MSCGSCAPGGCSPIPTASTASSGQLLVLLAAARRAARAAAVTGKDPNSAISAEALTAVALVVSRGDISGVAPLSAVEHVAGALAVLDAAEDLVAAGLRGALVSWAFEHCGRDAKRLEEAVMTRDDKLIQAVNDRAELFELFPGNPAVGRAAWPDDPRPQRGWGHRGSASKLTATDVDLGRSASKGIGKGAYSDDPAAVIFRRRCTGQLALDSGLENHCDCQTLTGRLLALAGVCGLGLIELYFWWSGSAAATLVAES